MDFFKARLKNYFILILIVSIVILAILIVLIFFIYRKCVHKNSLSNKEIIEKGNQNELPIIPE